MTKVTRPIYQAIFTALLTVSFTTHLTAEENTNSKTAALTKHILSLDKQLFDAVNSHDVETVKSMFTKDLEFYHDKGGLENYEQTVRSIENLAKDAPNLFRELINEGTEVYEIKGFGAMQKGKHRFCKKNQADPDCGTFQFIHIWKNDAGTWRISRVISYDH